MAIVINHSIRNTVEVLCYFVFYIPRNKRPDRHSLCAMIDKNVQ